MTDSSNNSRRDFLERITAGSAVGITALLSSLDAMATPDPQVVTDAEKWLTKIKGKHKLVLDGSEIHSGFPIVWAWVHLMTNNQTGVADADMTAVVTLRHKAVPMALNDAMWEKYKIGEALEIKDPATGNFATRNIYNVTAEPMWVQRGIQGIHELSARGVMFCVCELALTSMSSAYAKKFNLTPLDVKKEWMSQLLPGIQPVPSGVWAIARAQQMGCAYCYAGG